MKRTRKRIEPVQIGNAMLYLGDCLEILPTLGKVDAVITDPPYGIGFDYVSYDDTLDGWREKMLSIIAWTKANAEVAIMPSCQIKQLPWIYKHIPPDWIVCWYKGSPGHRAHTGFNDWEPHLVYGKRQGTQFHDYFYAPPSDGENGHPCPKSIAWARWLVSRATLSADTILDPFMGSGTTGVACIKLGRKFIGIEIEPKYFDIACKRIEKIHNQISRMPKSLFEDQKPRRKKPDYGFNLTGEGKEE